MLAATMRRHHIPVPTVLSTVMMAPVHGAFR